jgi:hypothetical protein
LAKVIPLEEWHVEQEVHDTPTGPAIKSILKGVEIGYTIITQDDDFAIKPT